VNKGNGFKHSNGDTALNFEVQLWAAADKLRGRSHHSDCKHLALDLIFLEYIADASVVGIQSSNQRREAPARRNKKAEMMESFSITALRDALLPKLLSGELCVPAKVI
jgi:hypothetical protein